ncbi:hypothetical protein V8D89_006824 [Ganoderma adspersum]
MLLEGDSDSATHRVLRIIEVYECVCEAADRKSLAQLARTCKAFYNTTKRKLWRTIPSLSPLIRCFPGDSWMIAEGTMKTTRIILPHEWTRFLENAQLVRAMGFDPAWQLPQLSVSAMETLTGLRPTLVLFPNIRALDSSVLIDGLKPEYLPMVLLMMGSGLRTLHIGSLDRGIIPEAVFRASINLSATCFPNLQKVKLSALGVAAGDVHLETSLSVSSFLSSLSSLRRLESITIPLTLDVIKSLAKHPTLRVFATRLPDSTNWPVLQQVPRPVAALTEICLFSTIQTYTAFAQAVALPHVERFTLWIKHVALDADSNAQFFTALRHQLSPATLRSLTIGPGPGPGIMEARATQVVRSSHLRPLLDFAELERFDLAMVCHSALDTAFLRDLARAWPRLTYLSLLCDRFCALYSLPPLNALAPFAMHCRDLRTLRVTVYAASGRQEDVDLVAMTIARMFPSLSEVLYGGFSEGTDPQGRYRAAWKDVSGQYLPMFALVRQDERLRISQEDRERGGG